MKRTWFGGMKHQNKRKIMREIRKMEDETAMKFCIVEFKRLLQYPLQNAE